MPQIDCASWMRLISALLFSLTLLYLIVATSVAWFPETAVDGERREAARTSIALVLAFGLVLTVARMFSALGHFLLDESFEVLREGMETGNSDASHSVLDGKGGGTSTRYAPVTSSGLPDSCAMEYGGNLGNRRGRTHSYY